MSNFLTGVLVTVLVILAVLFLAGVPKRDSHTLNALTSCEKSLPRDQKCIIVAIRPQEDIPLQKEASTEQKALNEIKGDTK
jgi:hypothetical protein